LYKYRSINNNFWIVLVSPQVQWS